MKQKKLWEDNVEKIEKPELELYEPLPDKLNKCKNILSNERVPDLMPKYLQLKKLFVKYQPVILTSKGEKLIPTELVKIANTRGNVNKGPLIDFVAFFLADSRNFAAYFGILDEPVQKVWRLIIENYFASNTMLKKKTQHSWMSIERGYFSFNPVSISDKLPWFISTATSVNYSLQNYYMYMPLYYRQFLHPFFFTQKVNALPPLEELHQEESLQIFNEEKAIFKLLPVIESLYRQNILSLGKNKITTSALKKASKLLNAGEFFPEEKDATASTLRSSMLLTTYSACRSMLPDQEGGPETLIKNFIMKIIRYPSFLLAITIPHVNGIRSNILSESYTPGHAHNILELLASYESGKWVNVERIRLQLYSYDIERGYNMLFPGYILAKAEFVNAKHNKENIMLDEVYSDVVVPFIKGFLFLLASMGIVEAAYGGYDSESISYCCSLRYVRLTPLGEFVLGKKEAYTVETDEKDVFEINGDDLIIRSANEANPYESLLTDICVPIGYHRYKVTYGSFLKNCSKQKDIEDKISFFKRYICSNPPQNWNNFFQSLTKRCHPLSEVDEEKYVICKLKPEDKELQHLISTDPYIRKYTKRAEDYMLLIEAQHLSYIANYLKTFGYLL